MYVSTAPHATGAFDTNEMCRFFFSGNSLQQVDKLFVNGLSPELSFKKLRRLSILLTPETHKEFLCHLLYHYKDLDFQVHQGYGAAHSTYSTYVRHNIELNPNLKLTHCDIRMEDLRFKGIEDILSSWVNLESISVYITPNGDCMNTELCLSKMMKIFKTCA